MVVKFLAPAQAELAEAVAYYNSQKSELGSQFAEEVRRTIERILQYPKAWTPLSKRTRRCRTNKFPYGFIYPVRGDVLLIVAVMHLHREPQMWKSRLGRIFLFVIGRSFSRTAWGEGSYRFSHL